jgi:hypothetical protein
MQAMTFEIGWTANSGEWEKAYSAAVKPIDERERRETEYLAIEQLLHGWLFFQPEQGSIDHYQEGDTTWPWYVRPSVGQNQSTEAYLLSGMPFRLIDVALQLTNLIPDFSVNSRSQVDTVLYETDGPGQILLRRSDGGIRIYYRDEPGVRINTSSAEFVAGCERFLHWVANEIDERTPALFSWNIMQPLIQYRKSDTS